MGFICRRCGKCCTNLLQKEKTLLRGLTLLPNEINLFPKGNLRPYLGVGKQPQASEFKILAYQLNTDICPHLIDNHCKYYKMRPSSCRQFPFSLDLDPEASVIFGIDLNCPSARMLMNNSEGKIEFHNIESAMNLLELKKHILNVLKNVWIYDLSAQKWQKHNR